MSSPDTMTVIFWVVVALYLWYAWAEHKAAQRARIVQNFVHMQMETIHGDEARD